MDGHLSVIDTVADSASRDTVINDIELGDPPTALCIAPNQRWVYAINHFDHVVWAVHTATKRTAAIRLPAYPYRISLSPNGLRLYASLCGDGSTCVIDTDPGSARYRRVIARLRVDGYGPDPVFSTAGARAYVVNSDANSVSVIDTPTQRGEKHCRRRVSMGRGGKPGWAPCVRRQQSRRLNVGPLDPRPTPSPPPSPSVHARAGSRSAPPATGRSSSTAATTRCR